MSAHNMPLVEASDVLKELVAAAEMHERPSADIMARAERILPILKALTDASAQVADDFQPKLAASLRRVLDEGTSSEVDTGIGPMIETSEAAKEARAQLEAYEAAAPTTREHALQLLLQRARSAKWPGDEPVANPSSIDDLPKLPIGWRRVEDNNGVQVEVFRAFQMRDYARLAVAAHRAQWVAAQAGQTPEETAARDNAILERGIQLGVQRERQIWEYRAILAPQTPPTSQPEGASQVLKPGEGDVAQRQTPSSQVDGAWLQKTIAALPISHLRRIAPENGIDAKHAWVQQAHEAAKAPSWARVINASHLRAQKVDIDLPAAAAWLRLRWHLTTVEALAKGDPSSPLGGITQRLRDIGDEAFGPSGAPAVWYHALAEACRDSTDLPSMSTLALAGIWSNMAGNPIPSGWYESVYVIQRYLKQENKMQDGLGLNPDPSSPPRRRNRP